MMKKAKWQAYENNLARYLNNTYHKDGLSFHNKGGSDAFCNDILVYQKSTYYFSIEAKYLPSQCGQITLQKNDGTFIFSKRSRQKFMPQTQVIIDLINRHEDLQENDPRFFDWITAYYYQKNATWFALSESHEKLNANNLYLCRTKDLHHYVNVNATLRKKKSGSTRVPHRLIDKALKLISQKLPDAKCETQGFFVKKLFVACQNHPKELYLNEELYLSSKGEGHYEVRKLSKTKTWSVTFSMELKKHPAASTMLL